MGEVFLATDPSSSTALVVKRILPHLLENPRFLRLFLDETRIAARLDHPNIVRIFELGEAGGTWFVAMEHVPGKDLRDLLKRSRELGHHVPLEVVVSIGVEIARGLAYAHHATDAQGRQLRIVHRDVSPHNVLIAKDGRVKLIDFGVAKAANKSVHTATGILKGKFPYMSPEQAQARPVDPRTDVFALGIVLWEALCARYLFRGKSDAATLKLVREALVPPPSTLRDDVPEALERVLLKSLKKDPKERYQTADAFREALENVLAALPAPDIAKWFAEYDDVSGLDDLFSSSEPDSEEASRGSAPETQIESQDLPTVADSPSRATNPVRPRPALVERSNSSPSVDTPSNAKLKELLGQVAARPTNIGSQTTSFVGRVAELADLHQLFRQGARLITLLGPGGTGKTRLSLQFGSQLITHFEAVEKGKKRGGVWFCDLTEARDREGVCAAVARALSVPLAQGDAVKQLGHALSARGETLLVLDNFEQVVAVANETVGAWFKSAPLVRFVVSSRELLRVEDETVFEVPPLRTPTPGQGDLRGAEAVQLFIERARVVRPGWEPDAPELAAIAELVRQLDGMPLAIELAAGRAGVLNPSQLVSRLPQRFSILVNRQGAVERQATLRGAIDWSWQSLSTHEASMLAQLSVFRGGFSAQAAEAVVLLDTNDSALSVLMGLRAKSLVRAYFPTGDENQTRFGLYETIREYAYEKLQKMPELEGALQRHNQHFLALGKRLSEGAEGNKARLDELDLERENLSIGYRRSVDAKRRADALGFCLALDPLLALRGPFGLQLAMLDEVIELVKAEPRLACIALEARGRARSARGRNAEAESDLLDALELAARIGDTAAPARAEYMLGAIERLKGQRKDAMERLEAAVVKLAATGQELHRGRALSHLAVLRHEMAAENKALETYADALEIHRRVGDRRFEGITLANLGVQQQAFGLLKQARANYQAALAIHRELGNRRSEGISQLNLADLAADLEQPGVALAHYELCLQICREVGARRWEGIALYSVATLHLQYGEYPEAAAKIHDAIEILQEIGEPRYLGLSYAVQAAVQALQGDVDGAEEPIAEGARLLLEVGDAAFLDALDLYRGHLELARTLQTGPSQAGVLMARVNKRIEHAETPGGADELHPTGTPSPADRSEHVRGALRSLRGALADNEQTLALDQVVDDDAQ